MFKCVMRSLKVILSFLVFLLIKVLINDVGSSLNQLNQWFRLVYCRTIFLYYKRLFQRIRKKFF